MRRLANCNDEIEDKMMKEITKSENENLTWDGETMRKRERKN
jgi:hypothetical protein